MKKLSKILENQVPKDVTVLKSTEEDFIIYSPETQKYMIGMPCDPYQFQEFFMTIANGMTELKRCSVHQNKDLWNIKEGTWIVDAGFIEEDYRGSKEEQEKFLFKEYKDMEKRIGKFELAGPDIVNIADKKITVIAQKKSSGHYKDDEVVFDFFDIHV